MNIQVFCLYLLLIIKSFPAKIAYKRGYLGKLYTRKSVGLVDIYILYIYDKIDFRL